MNTTPISSTQASVSVISTPRLTTSFLSQLMRSYQPSLIKNRRKHLVRQFAILHHRMQHRCSLYGDPVRTSMAILRYWLLNALLNFRQNAETATSARSRFSASQTSTLRYQILTSVLQQGHPQMHGSLRVERSFREFLLD